MGWGPLLGVSRGAELALRAGVAPLLLGARLAWRRADPADPEMPARRLDAGAAAKVFLDEFFFATEIALAEFVRPEHRRRVVQEIEQGVAFVEDGGFDADPRRFHADPPPPERVVLDRRRVGDLAYRHVRYASGFEPRAGLPGRERWLSYAANHTAHAWVLRHRGAERPWVVCVPGYRMGSPLVDFTGFRARWLYRGLGLNVAIPVLPLHGPRRVGRRTGDGFFTGDFVDTLHAQTQAAWDVRRLVAWLRDRGAPAVGLHGVSLGGFTTALVASLEDGVDCVVAGIPATDLARLLRAHVPAPLRWGAEWGGFSLPRIDRLLWPVSPFALAPRVPRERRFLYAGLHDRLTPPDHARDLWRHWDRPRVHWYQGGHVSFLFERGVGALLEEAFATLPRDRRP